MSEAPWSLPSHWTWTTLGELPVDVQSGFASGIKDVTDGISHLRMHNIASDCTLNLDLVRRVPKDLARGKYLVRSGDVLFCHTNSRKLVGKTALFPSGAGGPFAFSNHLTRLRTDPTVVVPEWLWLVLANLWYERYFEERCKEWVNQATIQKSVLLNAPIPLPALDEQQRICELVERLLRDCRNVRGILDQVLALTGRLRESVASRIFNGDTKPLEQIASLFNGKAIGSGNSNVRVFKTRHVYPSGLRMDNPSFLKPEQEIKIPANRYLREGDVLVVNTWQNLGRVCYVAEAADQWTVDTQIMIVRLHDMTHGKWIFHFLNSRAGYEQLLACERGQLTAGPSRKLTHIYPRDVGHIPIPMPREDGQGESASRLDASLNLARGAESEAREAGPRVIRLERAIISGACQGEFAEWDPEDRRRSILAEVIRSRGTTKQ